MGILRIENRTENWKTAQLLDGLSDAGKVALVRKVGEPDATLANDIRIELFWYGVRDGKPVANAYEQDAGLAVTRQIVGERADVAADLASVPRRLLALHQIGLEVDHHRLKLRIRIAHRDPSA